MAERTFELPDLGEGIAEGELVSWLVETGNTIEEDQTIAEVETDKAVVEVPSPYNGTIAELHAEEGETVPVGSVIVTFEAKDGIVEADEQASENVESATERAETDADSDDSESHTETVSQPDERVFAAPSTRTLARELGVDLAVIDGSGPGGRIAAADVRAYAESQPEPNNTTDAVSEPETADGEAGPAAEQHVLVESDDATRDRTLAMPATRQLAREAGVDINNVPASEQRDSEAFVTPDDVREYVESGSEASGTASASTTSGAASQTAGEPVSGERVPYKGIRRTIGEQMARSKYTAPHVSHHDEFDALNLVEVREELAAAATDEDVNLTYLSFVVKAVTHALKEFPYMNSSLDEDAEEIVLCDEYNIGIAVATEAGLMVPVVKHADQKSLVELAREIDDLATRARNRELSREEMQSGTFTITNIGVIGGEFSAPIINYPEAAILAMGPIRKRPWVVDDEVVARETMRLSISVDHRLVDGAEAAQFTNRVQELLGQPARLLL